MQEGSKPYWIDGKDPSHCNWMRFMNIASVKKDKNVAVYQFQGDIYYRTIKNIEPGCELLLSYAEEYAEEQFREKKGIGDMFRLSSKIEARLSGVEGEVWRGRCGGGGVEGEVWRGRCIVMELVNKTYGINLPSVYVRNEYSAPINSSK